MARSFTPRLYLALRGPLLVTRKGMTTGERLQACMWVFSWRSRRSRICCCCCRGGLSGIDRVLFCLKTEWNVRIRVAQPSHCSLHQRFDAGCEEYDLATLRFVLSYSRGNKQIDVIAFNSQMCRSICSTYLRGYNRRIKWWLACEWRRQLGVPKRYVGIGNLI